MRSLRSAYRGHRAFPLVLDVVLLVVFAAIGRASHDEPVTPAGVFVTAWPFVIALLCGWALVTLLRARIAFVWPAGLVVWFVTVAGGMLLRIATGDTAAFAFVVVASVTLAVFLLVPRAVFGGFRLPRGHADASSASAGADGNARA